MVPKLKTTFCHPNSSFHDCRIERQDTFGIPLQLVDVDVASIFPPWDTWLKKFQGTVGGRNPTKQLIGSLSHCFPGFTHPRWCTISSISRICGKEVRLSFVLVCYVCYVCFVGLIGGCGCGCGCCRYIVLFFGIRLYIFFVVV